MSSEAEISAKQQRIMAIHAQVRELPDDGWPANIKYQQEINRLQKEIGELRGDK